MDSSAIVGLATSMSQDRTKQKTQIALLNKALDAQTEIGAGMITALNTVRAGNSANLPPNLGKNINTTA